MATMILATERPTVDAASRPVIEILGDSALSMGEKLLMLEGLLVHDSTAGPQDDRKPGV